MNWVLKQRTAILLLLAGIVLVQIFHLLVLVEFIPYHLVGGGRIRSRQDMHLLETIALGVNFLLIFLLMIKARFIREYLSPRHVKWLLQIFGYFFLMNAMGNLFSSSFYEKVIFTPLTIVFAILIYFILRRNQP